jgi:saccharopine dehydrogenase-like NADP-dependent oxidoreductase
MAAPARHLLADHPRVDELVLADRDVEAAKAAAEACHGPVRPVGVDILHEADLRSVLAPADLVVNTAGPFFRLALPALSAAVATGTDYIDICDDWEPIEPMLALHRAAVDAGVTAVVGMGASPGLSNLLAVLASRQLDHVEHLYTAWPVDVDLDGRPDRTDDEDSGPSAAAVHWMQQISGSVTTVRGGELTATLPLEPVALDYPDRGRGTAYVVGHPEPIMFQRTFEPSGRSANVMVGTPTTMAFLDTLRADIDAGTLSLDEAVQQLDQPGPARLARAGLRSLRLAGPGRLPGFFALATGTRAGRELRCGARLRTAPAGMAAITGIPLAIGAGMLLDGAVGRSGVCLPERAFDPIAVFERLAPHCAEPGSRWTDVVEVQVG